MLEDPGYPLSVSHGNDQDLQSRDMSKLIASWCEGFPDNLVRFVLITRVKFTVMVVGDVFLPKTQSAMDAEAGEVASRNPTAYNALVRAYCRK